MIELKPFLDAHLDSTFEWMQDSELKHFFLLEKEISREQHYEWFKKYLNDKTQEIFAIYYNEIHVGNIGLKNMDLRNKKAEVWVYLGDNRGKGKGVALKALQTLEHSKNQYQKLYAQIADYNYNSLKTFVSAGYNIEGLLRNEFFFKGRFINIFRLSRS